jgi:hypothetical protein
VLYSALLYKKFIVINKSIFILAVSLMFISCSSYSNKSPMPSISDTARQEMDQPVNCKTARSDIKILEEEKASVGKQVLSGIRSVMPVAVVAGLLMGDYSDRVSVATGRYDSDIQAKIVQIKRVCNILQ